MPSSSPAHRGWTFGEFTLDLDRGALIRGGASVHLSPRPFAVLRHLVERHGRLVTKDELLDAIWGHRAVTDGAVAHSLMEIRRALGTAGQGYIRTVPRRGIVFEADVTPTPAAASASQPGPPEANLAAPAPKPATPVPRRVVGWVGGLALGVLVAILAQGWGLGNRTEDAVSPRVMPAAPYEAWRPSLAEIEPNSVAVLPFANLSADPEHEYFADGISEEILNRLSAFGELKVIARTSSFAFKDSRYDIARISGLLAVNYLLQGSVRRDGEQLRVAAQLVDKSGVQVWASSFDRDLGSIFTLQDEIAEAVATSIVPHIVPPATAPRLPDLEAYQEYLIGRELVARRAPYVHRAAERLTRAIELDPEFAKAYAERAVALYFDRFLDAESARETTVRALRDVERALALQPDLARAYAAHALNLAYEDEEHEKLLRRAIALEPTMVDALTWLANLLDWQRRWAESFELRERAARLDPLAPAAVANFSLTQMARGEFAEAERLALRMLEVPHVGDLHFAALFDVYLWTGRLVEAHQIARRQVLATTGQAEGWRGLLNLVLVYSALGLQKQAEDWQARAERINPKATPVVRSRIRVMLAFPPEDRQYDEAIAFVREITEPHIKTGDLGPTPAKMYGALLGLSGDYQGAIRLLEPWVEIPGAERGLARAWQKTGDMDKAAVLLARKDAEFRAVQAEGFLHRGADLASSAFNSLLLGDKQRALDLLEQAWEAGWRGHTHAWQLWPLLHDPAWDAVSDEPRFQVLIARLEADVDQQRAQVEKIDAEDDFAARFDAALATRMAEAAGGVQNR